MISVLRFAYLSLEAFFKTLSGDFLCDMKAKIVILCTQISMLFIMANMVFLVFGINWPQFIPKGFSLIVAASLPVLSLMIINRKFIDYDGGGISRYREIFDKMPQSKKIWGGVAIAIVVFVSVVGCGVTGSMVAEARRSAGLIQ
ncbi:MAG: hypothetical protein LBF16_05150 [Pseudomonadales bacterium]|nr:hypothetical protein [Pseudomonadales bacterium]